MLEASTISSKRRAVTQHKLIELCSRSTQAWFEPSEHLRKHGPPGGGLAVRGKSTVEGAAGSCGHSARSEEDLRSG